MLRAAVMDFDLLVTRDTQSFAVSRDVGVILEARGGLLDSCYRAMCTLGDTEGAERANRVVLLVQVIQRVSLGLLGKLKVFLLMVLVFWRETDQLLRLAHLDCVGGELRLRMLFEMVRMH